MSVTHIRGYYFSRSTRDKLLAIWNEHREADISLNKIVHHLLEHSINSYEAMPPEERRRLFKIERYNIKTTFKGFAEAAIPKTEKLTDTVSVHLPPSIRLKLKETGNMSGYIRSLIYQEIQKH